MKHIKSIVWFRQDLRLSDNPALEAASKLGEFLPIYILDDLAPAPFKLGSMSKVWIHHSLESLNRTLDESLNLYVGKSHEIIEKLIEQYNIENIFWNRCYEPWHLEQEEHVISLCQKTSKSYQRFNSNYLWGPEEVLKDDGSYYKVFTPYKKKAYLCPQRKTIDLSKPLAPIKDELNSTLLSDMGLIPEKSWHKAIEQTWDIGEHAAQQKLKEFINAHLSGYKHGRDYPASKHTSRLSPHLHFGEISPAQIFEKISHVAPDGDTEHFLSEVIWREFSCYLLYHFKDLHTANLNQAFNKFPWQEDSPLLKAWKIGKTGYPLVDAGMRELWQTGYMHNRIRMVTASFLIKNLNIHWHRGRDWFWDCLLDADLANNSASWQWVAGCGADAAPYFRIFNTITQGEKFDENGEYTRKFVPELKNLPNKYLFDPWNAPDHILKEAGVILGETYPKPIVDLSVTRNQALEYYQNL